VLRLRLTIATLLVALLSPAWADTTRSSNLIYLESSEAPRPALQERVNTCLQLLLADMKLESKSLPTIVVLHVSVRESDHAGFPGFAVKLRRNNDPNVTGQQYYELWLAGEPTPFQYTTGIFTVLTDYFHLQPDEVEKKRTIARVARYLETTVSAKAR
jgi:hypothetical protein